MSGMHLFKYYTFFANYFAQLTEVENVIFLNSYSRHLFEKYLGYSFQWKIFTQRYLSVKM